MTTQFVPPHYAMELCHLLTNGDKGTNTMNDMMSDGGAMWGMSLGALVVFTLLALAIAALAKYIFFK